jgi:hypothetical protein
MINNVIALFIFIWILLFLNISFIYSYIYIIDKFINFNLYHVDTCHYLDYTLKTSLSLWNRSPIVPT